MSVSQRIWRVGQPPQRLVESRLASEQELEEMIVAKPEIVSDEWMVIGRQEDTGFGGRIDLLAIAPDSSLILIELKRGRTPREVVAQALDYATWVEALDADSVMRVYTRFKAKSQEHGDLAKDFEARFGIPLDAEVFPGQHQIVIVASALDAGSERIVSYLSKRSVAINVLCFEMFEHGTDRLLSRAWLRDPVESQTASSAVSTRSPSSPWNGEYYVSFGGRSWDEARKYGFISAGGGAWYSNTLKLLKPGDRIWVKIPGKGFVGVGRVTGVSTPLIEFKVDHDGRQVPVADVVTQGELDATADPEKMEYFVPVAWLDTVCEDHAINEPGLFGNTNSVCAPKTPKWRTTIERLQRAFPRYDSIQEAGTPSMRQTDTTSMLQALAAFGPELRDPRATPGRWADQKGTGTIDDPLTMPYFEASDLLDRFVDMTYRAGWIKEFDWMKWSAGAEAEGLLRDKAALAQATIDQIAHVIITIVRSDRFSEGELAAHFDGGVLLALAERAEALLAAECRAPRVS